MNHLMQELIRTQRDTLPTLAEVPATGAVVVEVDSSIPDRVVIEWSEGEI